LETIYISEIIKFEVARCNFCMCRKVEDIKRAQPFRFAR